jgi:pyridine nucleotide-disulfide oxidoreductase family protein
MKRLLLVGAGHAHALVLLDWMHAPLRGVELVVVSPHGLAPYSGMVPGWLAGAYRFDEIVIDFPALCGAAGARWIEGELDTLDATRQRITLHGGEAIGYDVLSLNVGSTLTPPALPGTPVLALRPLSALQPAYDALLARWCTDASHGPFTVTAVGGGAAGFESLLAVLARLRALRADRTVRGRLVARGARLLPELSGAARRAAHRALARAGVDVQLGTRWDESMARGCDLVLWAAGAEAHAWQRDPSRRGALAVSERGFIRIDAQLRSLSHHQVFAAGDCTEWSPPLPKAGVYAVRMGPVLSHNLRAALGNKSDAAQPRDHRPQRHFLALLGTGDGRAIASRGPFGASGRWAWRWKERIDRRFIARFDSTAQPAAARRAPADASSCPPSGDPA